LSAFFGLDDKLPDRAARICPVAPGRDGVVVNVADPLDPNRVDQADVVIITADGERRTPLCASLLPAIEPGERRTVLLIGDLGSAADPPQRVELPNGLPTADPAARDRYRGASFEPVTQLADGPFLVIAEREVEPALAPAGDPDACPTGTPQVLRVAWAGGVTRVDGAPTTDADAAHYHVTVRSSDGATREIAVVGIVDANDGDNYHELCLPTADPALEVRVDPGSFVDPNGDPNPATHLTVAG
ncbi:MAG: hypothetical protein R2726_16985, partial [Acidimicrobiales bacterium]